jgi:hypothetical protein
MNGREIEAARSALSKSPGKVIYALCLLVANVVDGSSPGELEEWLDGAPDLADELMAWRLEQLPGTVT